MPSFAFRQLDVFGRSAAPPLLRHGPVEVEMLDRVTRGLGLAPEGVVASSWVDNGPGWVALMLGSRAAVLAASPDFAALSSLSVGLVGPWDERRDGTEAAFEVRGLSGVGGYEDPVTGSLNAGIAQWLIGSGRAPPSYVAGQGTALGRAGRVHLRQEGAEIWVGGAVWPCVAGSITV